MADIVDQKTRSRIMVAIGGKNTKPKMVLHKAMHARGFCYRLHGKGIIFYCIARCSNYPHMDTYG